MFCCWRTAMRCPAEGRLGWSPRRISPSTILPEVDAVASARMKSRSKPLTFLAQHALAKGNLGQLDRVGNHDVEADNLGAAVHDGAQHAADLAGPGHHRRTLERCGALAFLVDRNHDRRRGRRIVPATEHLPPQRGENIDGQPMDRLTTGETETAAQTNAIATTAIVSRVVRPIFKMRGPTTLFHAQQAADNRRRAGLGLRVDLEHDL